MNDFVYTKPKLYKDKDNKKWFVHYRIKYQGEENYIPIKEYGRFHFDMSLNTIANLKERDSKFQALLSLVERDLKNGNILNQPAKLKELDDKVAEAAKKYTYDENLQLYLRLKGYINPVAKKERTAEAIESFHRNQFKPFLEKKKLAGDITKITKAHLLEFMNSYYLNTNPAVKWSNNTFNIKKALLSTFFQTMVDEDIIMDNPAKRVKSKPTESTERFAIFTKEERDLLFDYLDKGDYPFLAAISKTIYYSYIRETELSRLQVSDFDLENRRIRIHPDNAKGQKDQLVKFVKMTLPLQAALALYLSKFEHTPDYYMFGKKYRPSQYRSSTDWIEIFAEQIAELKLLHPGKFTRKGLTPYALKHSGVTDFINDNAAKYSTTDLYNYVQQQCRHTSFAVTQRYFKKLELNLDVVDTFDFI